MLLYILVPVISTPMPGHHPPMSVTPVPYPGANVTMQQGNNTMATAPAGAQTGILSCRM